MVIFGNVFTSGGRFAGVAMHHPAQVPRDGPSSRRQEDYCRMACGLLDVCLGARVRRSAVWCDGVVRSAAGPLGAAGGGAAAGGAGAGGVLAAVRSAAGVSVCVWCGVVPTSAAARTSGCPQDRPALSWPSCLSRLCWWFRCGTSSGMDRAVLTRLGGLAVRVVVLASSAVPSLDRDGLGWAPKSRSKPAVYASDSARLPHARLQVCIRRTRAV